MTRAVYRGHLVEVLERYTIINEWAHVRRPGTEWCECVMASALSPIVRLAAVEGRRVA